MCRNTGVTVCITDTAIYSMFGVQDSKINRYFLQARRFLTQRLGETVPTSRRQEGEHTQSEKARWQHF